MACKYCEFRDHKFRDHKRHPLSFVKWIDAVQKEDITECGKVVHSSGEKLFRGYERYKKYWREQS